MSKVIESKLKSKSKSKSNSSHLVCERCEQKFANIYCLQRHKNNSTGKTQLKCVFCQYSTIERCLLTLHEQKSHRQGDLFKCPLAGCNFAKRKRDTVIKHFESHCPKTLTCPYVDSGSGSSCDYKTNLRDGLKKHMKRHRTDSEKKHKCGVCGYKSHLAWDLKLHMLTHTEERPYKCKSEGCDYEGKDPSNFNKHIKAVHKKLRPFKCPFCSYECTERRILLVHQARRHPQGFSGLDLDSDSVRDAQNEEDPLKLD